MLRKLGGECSTEGDRADAVINRKSSGPVQHDDTGKEQIVIDLVSQQLVGLLQKLSQKAL